MPLNETEYHITYVLNRMNTVISWLPEGINPTGNVDC